MTLAAGARIEAYFGSSKLDHLVEKGKGRTATWVCRMAIVIDTHRQQPSAASCSHAPGVKAMGIPMLRHEQILAAPHIYLAIASSI